MERGFDTVALLYTQGCSDETVQKPLDSMQLHARSRNSKERGGQRVGGRSRLQSVWQAVISLCHTAMHRNLIATIRHFRSCPAPLVLIKKKQWRSSDRYVTQGGHINTIGLLFSVFVVEKIIGIYIHGIQENNSPTQNNRLKVVYLERAWRILPISLFTFNYWKHFWSCQCRRKPQCGNKQPYLDEYGARKSVSNFKLLFWLLHCPISLNNYHPVLYISTSPIITCMCRIQLLQNLIFFSSLQSSRKYSWVSARLDKRNK